MPRAVLLLLFFSIASPLHAELPNIIPLPKQMKSVGAAVPMKGFVLLVSDAPMCRIAAQEINKRIASLGGQPLPVLGLSEHAPGANTIVLGPSTHPRLAKYAAALHVTPAAPGPQGYAIGALGGPRTKRIILIGSDDLGALYAAMTCRQLITKRKGRVAIQPAEIRDWPDFKDRKHGMSFAENWRTTWYSFRSYERRGDTAKASKLAAEYVATVKHYVDFLVRAKINMMWHSTNIKPGDSKPLSDLERKVLNAVHDYARARGISSFTADTTAIGKYPRDKDNPDFRDVVRHRSHNRYFCWSRLSYHEARAKRAARFLYDAGYKGYFLHATDGGGWQNPALWNDRCALCRKTYGDDHAKADSVVFGIYYREIKKLVPDLKFVAVVYPYTGRYLDPDYIYGQASAIMGAGAAARQVAHDTTQKLTRFLKRLDSLLPQDIYVCIRESERRHADLAHAAWGKRQFQFYYEYAFWKGWRPIFITTPLWTKTLYYPKHEDILFSPMGAWGEMTQLLGAECSWNTARPGAADFNSERWRLIGTAMPCPPERKSFAERGSRFMFGDVAGPLIAPAFAENISLMFIGSPAEVLKRLRIADPSATMREQAEATARAAASLDTFWERQQRAPVLDGFELRYFKNLYLMIHGAQVLATHQAHMMAARAAIQHGDSAGVQRELNADETDLAKLAPSWAALKRAIPLKDCLQTYVRPASREGKVVHVDVDKLRKNIRDLASRADKLIAAYTLPRWFERTCRKREVVAWPVDKPPTIDGKLDEPAWAEAPAIGQFMDHQTLRLEALETQARVLYDRGHLYVAFECYDPAPSDIATFLPGRDEYELADSIELLLAARSKSKQFVHWIVDSKGTVFDARAAKRDDGVVKYSREWNGHAQVAASYQADRWIVEMAIPAADLPTKPGRNGRILLCRNIVHTRPKGEEEQNACVFLDGSGFHTVSKFAPLRYAHAGETKRPPQLGLVLRNMGFKHVPTGDGSGTRIEGDLHFETDTNLHDVRVSVGFSDGVEPLGSKALDGPKSALLIWRPARPFFALIRSEAPGVVCPFKLTSREGEWTFVRKFGSPKRKLVPASKLFVPGVAGQALASPAFFPSANPKTIDLQQGTVEFWVKPDWTPVRLPDGPAGALAHTFFNLGPIRPDYPQLSNYSSLTIAHQAYGSLSCIIADRHYKARSLGAPIQAWRKGHWRHVAIQWDMRDDAEPIMQLYVDGQIAADRVQIGKPGKMNLGLPALPIQIGSMNTGYAPANAAIDELRISSIRRYSASFAPLKRAAADRNTLALFHFDGALHATAPEGLVAVAGTAQ